VVLFKIINNLGEASNQNSMTILAESKINLSIVIPVYNRPIEVEELLKSLCEQTNNNFEVIIVDDGSTNKCENQVEQYKAKLNIKYFYKQNTGPGLSRNFGNKQSSGNYTVFLDSDCILPSQYVQTIHEKLGLKFVDAFGGPDMADKNFSVLQKSINYAMTSFLTTGGIRGGGEKLDKFYPRSFNMGYSKQVFEKTGGFSGMRFGEDIDMSIRILNNGFKTELIKEAFVYHKRRTNFKQFFKQVYNSGIARINLFKRHPGSLKLVHTFPSLFTLGSIFLLILSLTVSQYFIMPLIIYFLLIFVDAIFKNKSMQVGVFSIFACICQLFGYGTGFLVACWNRLVLSKPEYSAFVDNFYD
jgi:glycosyltransferase involved in cell wall biosynthesis